MGRTSLGINGRENIGLSEWRTNVIRTTFMPVGGVKAKFKPKAWNSFGEKMLTFVSSDAQDYVSEKTDEHVPNMLGKIIYKLQDDATLNSNESTSPSFTTHLDI